MKATVSVKIIAVIAGFLLALGSGYFLGVHRHEQEPAATGTEGEKPKVQYTCSMHPFIIRDAPGFCPICSMALTPVKPGGREETESGAQTSSQATDTIRIDPVTLQNMGVRTEKAVKRALQRSVRTVGLVTVADDRQYSVNSKIEGWVERLHVNQQGQVVKKGQPLLEIYSPELVAAQQEYLLAAQNRRRLADSAYPEIGAGAERLLEAARTRLRYWDIGPDQIKALEQSGQIRKTLTLHSEHSGIVTNKKVLAGARIMPGEELLQIADLSTVWVIADIYEYELPWVKVGQPARVELPYAAGKTINGKIAYIYPTMETETRTSKARIEVANTEWKLKPAMYVNVNIVTEAVEAGLAIPVTAILNSGVGQTVFVALGEGRFEPRVVQSGLRDDSGAIQILSGLNEGDMVVVSAQFMLDSESRLREALDKMLAPKQEGAAQPAESGKAGSEKKPDAKSLDDLFK